MARCTPATLLAALIAAFAFLTAGCSHVATAPDDDEDLVAADDEPLPPGAKVDEADIASAGPSQIEDAIERSEEHTSELQSPI